VIPELCIFIPKHSGIPCTCPSFLSPLAAKGRRQGSVSVSQCAFNFEDDLVLSEGASVAVLETNVFCPRGRHSAGSRMSISGFPLPFSFQGAQQAATLRTAGEGREHRWGCWRAPRSLAGRRWAEVAVTSLQGKGLLKGCLVPN